ncbi:glycosyltransferase family 4 protein [Geomonas agri]|uniref:glycosyltransferase family 4 protein n=1 Tax=Geomonas agri TaxID=2873702 RepID=UPI001CD7B24F|nr:glycosyltransferase family 4 protein [Geomonas agri]
MNPIPKSNILLVANYKSDVGFAWWLMENFWAQIADSFSDVASTILLYPEIDIVPDVIKNAPIKLMQHDFSDRSFSSIRSLVRIIKDNSIDFVYLTDKKYLDWVYLLLRIYGVHVIVNHDHLPGERTKVGLVKKLAKKAIHVLGLFSCDWYIGVSRFVMNRMMETACVPASKCTYIHNGIRLFDDSKTSYAYECFGIDKRAKIIVSTGRATYYKGIDFLIKCAKRLKEEPGTEEFFFLHIGDGPDLEKFKLLALEMEVADRFLFAGFRTDITKILPSCEIGIQASLGEAFSLSILEYMCAGLVTIVPDNCGNSEAVKDGENGFLFVPGDIDSAVEKIFRAITDNELATALKKAARATVERHFNLEICNKSLIANLRRVWGAHLPSLPEGSGVDVERT